MTDIKQIENQEEWDELVLACDGHPLQLWGWGEVKAAHGWRVVRVAALQEGRAVGGAQLLIKRLPKPFPPFVYVPRGPFGELLKNSQARDALVRYVRTTLKPLVLSVEPDTVGGELWQAWKRAKNNVLLPRTAVMDLTKSDEELQAVMSKKTRQYIRKSAGEGITVETAISRENIAECLAIYKQTAQRAGFALHDDEYYYDIFEKLGKHSPVHLARYQGRVVAFLWPVVTDAVAFELYGGMNDEGQALRANYHLKWSVIQAMKAQGVRRYDVNGLLNDGVTAFKKGFIPEETMMSGTYDYPMSPLYAVWSAWLPLAKKIVRAVKP